MSLHLKYLNKLILSIIVLTLSMSCWDERADCPEFSYFDIHNNVQCEIEQEMYEIEKEDTSLLVKNPNDCIGVNNDSCDRILHNDVSWRTKEHSNEIVKVRTYYEFQTNGNWQIYSLINIYGNRYHEKREGTFNTIYDTNILNTQLTKSSCPSDEMSIFSYYDKLHNSYYVVRDSDELLEMLYSVHPQNLKLATEQSKDTISYVLTKLLNVYLNLVASLILGPFSEEFWIDLWNGDVTSGHDSMALEDDLENSTEICFSEESFPTPELDIPNLDDYKDDLEGLKNELEENISEYF